MNETKVVVNEEDVDEEEMPVDTETEVFTDYEKFYDCALTGGKDCLLVDKDGNPALEYDDESKVIRDPYSLAPVEDLGEYDRELERTNRELYLTEHGFKVFTNRKDYYKYIIRTHKSAVLINDEGKVARSGLLIYRYGHGDGTDISNLYSEDDFYGRI